MGRISLIGLEFFAFHGWYAEEQRTGTQFTVNLSFDADFEQARTSDELSGTIDYQQVLAAIQSEMAIPSKLIEHVASRIIKRVEEEFPLASTISVEIIKHRPFPNQSGDVSVVLKSAGDAGKK